MIMASAFKRRKFPTSFDCRSQPKSLTPQIRGQDPKRLACIHKMTISPIATLICEKARKMHLIKEYSDLIQSDFVGYLTYGPII